jgi:hypothetical protein
MSAFLFMIDPVTLDSMSECDLIEVRDTLIKMLATKPTPGNAFECERRVGNMHTLEQVLVRLMTKEGF